MSQVTFSCLLQVQSRRILAQRKIIL